MRVCRVRCEAGRHQPKPTTKIQIPSSYMHCHASTGGPMCPAHLHAHQRGSFRVAGHSTDGGRLFVSATSLGTFTERGGD